MAEPLFDVAASSSSVPPGRAGETDFVPPEMTEQPWPKSCFSWHGQGWRRMEVNQEAEEKDPEK